MQTQAKKKRGRPRKNPLPEVPVVEQIEETPVVAEEKAPDGNVQTAIGIALCLNKRWVTADMGGKLIKIRTLKSRKSPKHQVFKVQHLEDNLYEEIR